MTGFFRLSPSSPISTVEPDAEDGNDCDDDADDEEDPETVAQVEGRFGVGVGIEVWRPWGWLRVVGRRFVGHWRSRHLVRWEEVECVESVRTLPENREPCEV